MKTAELQLTTKVHYRRDKVKGKGVREELYLLGGSPRRIELSPNYSVTHCDAYTVNAVLTNSRFREAELPYSLLEDLIKEIKEFKSSDPIFGKGSDTNLLTRIDRKKAKIRTELKKKLGYLRL